MIRIIFAFVMLLLCVRDLAAQPSQPPVSAPPSVVIVEESDGGLAIPVGFEPVISAGPVTILPSAPASVPLVTDALHGAVEIKSAVTGALDAGTLNAWCGAISLICMVLLRLLRRARSVKFIDSGNSVVVASIVLGLIAAGTAMIAAGVPLAQAVPLFLSGPFAVALTRIIRIFAPSFSERLGLPPAPQDDLLN